MNLTNPLLATERLYQAGEINQIGHRLLNFIIAMLYERDTFTYSYKSIGKMIGHHAKTVGREMRKLRDDGYLVSTRISDTQLAWYPVEVKLELTEGASGSYEYIRKANGVPTNVLQLNETTKVDNGSSSELAGTAATTDVVDYVAHSGQTINDIEMAKREAASRKLAESSDKLTLRDPGRLSLKKNTPTIDKPVEVTGPACEQLPDHIKRIAQSREDTVRRSAGYKRRAAVGSVRRLQPAGEALESPGGNHQTAPKAHTAAPSGDLGGIRTPLLEMFEPMIDDWGFERLSMQTDDDKLIAMAQDFARYQSLDFKNKLNTLLNEEMVK